MKHYYAKIHPRGFANEFVIHRFRSKNEREEWVSNHPAEFSFERPDPIQAKEARKWLAMKGDAVTTYYCDIVEH